MKSHTTLMAKMVSAILALSCLPELATAQVNLVNNGGFDTSATGWLTFNIGPQGGYKSAKGDPGGYFFLDATPSSSTYPTISQTINGLIPNDSYMILGNYAYSESYGSGSFTDPSFGVAMDSTFLFETATPTNVGWYNFSFFYTATSSSVVLSLSSQINGTPVSYLVDNIAMYAVPEPTSLALFGLAGMISAIFFRNRRQG